MTYLGKPGTNQTLVWNGTNFVAQNNTQPVTVIEPIFEWNGTDLSQFSDSTGLSVATSVADTSRNAIVWSPSSSTFEARLFNFELPVAYKIVIEIARTNSGLHTQALVSGQDTNHWFGPGGYGANLRMIGSDNGVAAHGGGTAGIQTATLNGLLYTIIGVTVQHSQNDLTQWVSKPSPELWLSDPGANGVAFSNTSTQFGALGAGWSTSGSFYPGIGYQTQSSPPASWEWLSFKVYSI